MDFLRQQRQLNKTITKLKSGPTTITKRTKNKETFIKKKNVTSNFL